MLKAKTLKEPFKYSVKYDINIMRRMECIEKNHVELPELKKKNELKSLQNELNVLDTEGTIIATIRNEALVSKI